MSALRSGIALCIGTVVSCAPSTQAANSSFLPERFAPFDGPRFHHPDAIVVEPDTVMGLQVLPGSGAPGYPGDARNNGIDAQIVMAFVVDSSGRVELPTLTVLNTMTSADPSRSARVTATALPFVQNICSFLAGLSFAWRKAPMRGLTVMPFTFHIGSGAPTPMNGRPMQAAFSATPRDELLRLLEAQPHCDRLMLDTGPRP